MDNEVRFRVFGSHMDTEASHFEQFRCKYGEVGHCEYDTGYYEVDCDLLDGACLQEKCPLDFDLKIVLDSTQEGVRSDGTFN